MKTMLSTICDLQSGYTARSGLKTAPGGIRALQLRDLHEEDDLDPASAPLYPLDPSLKQRYSAGAGDLLFRSRGNRNTAVVIAPDSTKAVVAILPLIVLRPNRDVVDSRYLAWFINRPGTQRYFHRYARGTRLRMIPKACLDDLEVELPDLDTQRLIVEIDALARRGSDARPPKLLVFAHGPAKPSAHPLLNDRALELREDTEHLKHSPAGRHRGVETLLVQAAAYRGLMKGPRRGDQRRPKGFGRKLRRKGWRRSPIGHDGTRQDGRHII